MPIKKRTTLPGKQTAPAYAVPGPSIDQLRRSALKQASDAEWANDHETADRFNALAVAYQQKLDNGEIYEIAF